MALVACAACRQPFYASCHDSACVDATCPYCEYGDDAAADGSPSTRASFSGDQPDAAVEDTPSPLERELPRPARCLPGAPDLRARTQAR